MCTENVLENEETVARFRHMTSIHQGNQSDQPM